MTAEQKESLSLRCKSAIEILEEQSEELSTGANELVVRMTKQEIEDALARLDGVQKEVQAGVRSYADLEKAVDEAVGDLMSYDGTG